jgi:hypothetical protein
LLVVVEADLIVQPVPITMEVVVEEEDLELESIFQ